MAYFTEGYLDFFSELALNNEKAWFDKNRSRYEKDVKEPFKSFVSLVIEELSKFEPGMTDLQPKDVSFRINRDIRFSKDKTPYNTWLSAAFVEGGKKNEHRPVYFMRFAVDTFILAGGMYHPNKEGLHKIRSELAKNSSGLLKAANSKLFKQYWGELQGEKNKVLPKEFKAAAEKEPLIWQKEFHYWKELPETEVLRKDLLEFIINHFKAAKPVNDWFDEVIN